MRPPDFLPSFLRTRGAAVAGGSLLFIAFLALRGCGSEPVPPPGPGAGGPSVSVSPFEPTTADVVERILDLAAVGPGDVLYDLGSGDGRILIAAARRGARAVGVELLADLVSLSRRRVDEAGFAGRVRVVHGDAFLHDVSEATVVTMYLLPAGTEALARKLRRELRPGTRVVSHGSSAGSWAPDRVVNLPPDVHGRERALYLWRIPDVLRSSDPGAPPVVAPGL